MKTPKTFMNREGFWRTEDKGSRLPMPIPRDKPWKGKREFLAALDNAQLHAKSLHCKGWSTCRLCKRKNGTVTFQLGDWEWPSGYAHYVLKHNVRPSLAFQEFILGETLK
jgi:hypothetical protein